MMPTIGQLLVHWFSCGIWENAGATDEAVQVQNASRMLQMLLVFISHGFILSLHAFQM